MVVDVFIGRCPSSDSLSPCYYYFVDRMLPTTEQNPDETWLAEAEAELTELAEEAEKVERLPDSLLFRSLAPGGVDLITPDPRYTVLIYYFCKGENESLVCNISSSDYEHNDWNRCENTNGGRRFFYF